VTEQNYEIPESLKHLISTHQTHKIAQEHLGITEPSLEGIALHFGTKIAERQAKWRPVFEGLRALKALRTGG
jgi:hypothetical protein